MRELTTTEFWKVHPRTWYQCQKVTGWDLKCHIWECYHISMG